MRLRSVRALAAVLVGSVLPVAAASDARAAVATLECVSNNVGRSIAVIGAEFGFTTGQGLPGSRYRGTINWGDGARDPVREGADLTHVYTERGEYPVTVTAAGVLADVDGNTESCSSSLPITTVEVIVKLRARFDWNPEVKAVKLDASPSVSADQITRYEWSYDDGTSAVGKKATHRFEDPGPHLVTLTIRDDYGQSAMATREVQAAEDREEQKRLDKKREQARQREEEKERKRQEVEERRLREEAERSNQENGGGGGGARKSKLRRFCEAVGRVAEVVTPWFDRLAAGEPVETLVSPDDATGYKNARDQAARSAPDDLKSVVDALLAAPDKIIQGVRPNSQEFLAFSEASYTLAQKCS